MLTLKFVALDRLKEVFFSSAISTVHLPTGGRGDFDIKVTGVIVVPFRS